MSCRSEFNFHYKSNVRYVRDNFNEAIFSNLN